MEPMGEKIPNDCRPPRLPRRIASRNGELIENPDSWRKIRETAAILHRENVLVLPGRAGIRQGTMQRSIDVAPPIG
jgi:hypothetical protein